MQITAGCTPGVPNIANGPARLALVGRWWRRWRNSGRTVFTARRRGQFDIVAVAATQAVETVGYGDSYICGSKNRCALRTGNVGVGAGVGSARAGDKVYSIFVFYNLYETVVFWESEIFA